MNSALSGLLKSTVAVVIYLITIELLSSWILIADSFDCLSCFNYYNFIQSALTFLVVLLFIYYVRNYTFQNLIEKVHYRWYLFAGLAGIGFVFFQIPLNLLYNNLFGTKYLTTFSFTDWHLLGYLSSIATILFGPVWEELFFRSYIQQLLQRKTSAWFAIMWTAILFALIHSSYLALFFDSVSIEWHHSYITFFGGLISGILYFKSKSVGPSIVFHIFWNLVATVS